MLASLKDFTAATKILLEAGANVETKNNVRITSAHIGSPSWMVIL